MAIENEDRWYVQFDSQEVRLMSLEELDEAFQQGRIHENTYLIQVGASDWQTLADVAGLSDSDEESSAVADPSEAETAAPPLTNAAYAMSVRSEQLPAQPRAAEATMRAVAAPISTWPPVVSKVSTAASPAYYPPSSTPAPSLQNSMAPVVQDVSDLDFDATPFKRSRKSLMLMAAAALAVVGSAGFALTRLDVPPQTPSSAAGAPVVAAAALPARLPFSELANTPPPAPPVAAAPEPESPSGSGRLSDDTKRALIDADKGRSDKRKTRSTAPTYRRSGSANTQSSVFRSGGNAHDPLNSAL